VLSLERIDSLISPEVFRVFMVIAAAWVALVVVMYLLVFVQFLNGFEQWSAILKSLRIAGQLNATVSACRFVHLS